MENKGAWLLIAVAAGLSAMMLREMWLATDLGPILYFAVCSAVPILYAYWVWLKFCKVRPMAPVPAGEGS